MKRREFIKGVSIASLGTVAMGIDIAKADNPERLIGLDDALRANMDPDTNNKVISCAIIGAGSRGNAYESYMRAYPGQIKLVAVADIDKWRCDRMADRHNLPQDNRFGDFHEFFKAGKIADCVFICLPDKLHYDAAMLAMDLKYDVLLEKPMAQTEQECYNLLSKSHQNNIIMGTCHVLRYTPFFLTIHKAIKDKVIGDIVRVDLTENVGHIHMSHSYVRGNWHNSKETTPIILSKSCHDLDIIRWLIDKPCKSVIAEAKQNYFTEKNAPKGAPSRCIEGCPVESTCPYSALEIYLRRRSWTFVFDLKKGTDEEIEEYLRTTNYGRCVFHMDNDQPDYYVSDFDFGDGVAATFTMEGLTPYGGRIIRVIGSKGFIEGNSDSNRFKFHDFRTNKVYEWSLSNLNLTKSGHGGGDWGIARDFIEAVAYHDSSKLSSTIDVSMESHIMGFECEKSRKTGKKINLKH